MDNNQNKLQQLPDQVKSFLVSEKATETNVFVYDKHGLDIDRFSTLTKLIEQVFLKELSLSDFKDRAEKESNLGSKEAGDLVKDIAGSRFLIINDWLDEDVEEFIKNLGGDPEEYQSYIKEQREAVKKREQELKEEKEEEERPIHPAGSGSQGGATSEEVQEGGQEMDPDKEKEESQEIFTKSLISLLNSKNKETLEDYNLLLIRLILDDPDNKFRDDLEKSLFANEEKLTYKKFILGEKEKRPTVGNWLRYFIKERGSDMFDNLDLSEFLVNSQNTKVLDKQEKNRVKKLLLLYRNIKFFYEFFKDKKVEEWQIFPIREEGAISQDREDKGIDQEKTPETVSQSEVSTGSGSRIESRIKELEEYKLEFPEESLERKTLEEEIKKLKNS